MLLRVRCNVRRILASNPPKRSIDAGLGMGFYSRDNALHAIQPLNLLLLLFQKICTVEFIVDKPIGNFSAI